MSIIKDELLAFVKQVNFISPWSRPKAGGKKIFLGSPSVSIIKSLFDILDDSAERLQSNLNININEIMEISSEGSAVNTNTISSYIPESIRNNIIKTLNKCRVFLINMERGERQIRIHFMYAVSQRLTNKFIYDALYRIYLWLSIVFKYASLNCGRELDVFIYFSEIEKKLPGEGIIDRQHVNTAFTTSCRPKIDIHIFRYEEWFKVFVHESFHCFGLDFSEMDRITGNIELQMIKPRFGLNPKLDIRMYETYSETWANIIHILFFSFFSCKTKSWDNVFRLFEKSLKNEQLFSIFQCCKVLLYNGLSYSDLCNGSMGSYNENSNVFSYYILKSALLFHADEFIEWCGQYHTSCVMSFQKTQAHIQRFSRLLIDMSCRKEYVSVILKMEEWMDINLKKKQYQKIRDTMRMTIYG